MFTGGSRYTQRARSPRRSATGMQLFRLGIVDAAGNKTTSQGIRSSVSFRRRIAHERPRGDTRRRGSLRGSRSKKRRASLTVRHRTKRRPSAVVLAAREALPDRRRDAGGQRARLPARAGGGRSGTCRPTGSGAFALRLPAGPSAHGVGCSYRALHGRRRAFGLFRGRASRTRRGDPEDVTSNRSGTGRRLRFSGRVSGESAARRVLVTIYALSRIRGRAYRCETVRANADGLFFLRVPVHADLRPEHVPL